MGAGATPLVPNTSFPFMSLSSAVTRKIESPTFRNCDTETLYGVFRKRGGNSDRMISMFAVASSHFIGVLSSHALIFNWKQNRQIKYSINLQRTYMWGAVVAR